MSLVYFGTRAMTLIKCQLVLNNLNWSIKFPMEVKIDGQLPFSEILLRWSENNSQLQCLRKSTHSDRYLCFHSNHYTVVKLEAITFLTALFICSEKSISLLEELEYIWAKKQLCLKNMRRVQYISKDLATAKYDYNPHYLLTSNYFYTISIIFVCTVFWNEMKILKIYVASWSEIVVFIYF